MCNRLVMRDDDFFDINGDKEMKITIEFDSKEDAVRALNVDDYTSALIEIRDYIRNKIKYTELSDETLTHFNILREIICYLPEMD